MKIVTVNLPVNYLKAIESLVGENGLYPSRSELIRVAMRDFLIRELESVQSLTKVQNPIVITNKPPALDPNLLLIGEKPYHLVQKDSVPTKIPKLYIKTNTLEDAPKSKYDREKAAVHGKLESVI